MQKIPKNILIIGAVIILAIIGAVLYFFLGSNTTPKLLSAEAKNGDITENINLTGQVKASQGVDLAFEMQGKITNNYVKVGDKIYAGQALIVIDSSILQSQLQQAQAQLSTLNIDVVKSKADSSLQTQYLSSLSAAQKSASTVKDILFTISDIQYNHFISQTQENIALQSAKEKAVYSLLGKENAGLWTTQSISSLNGGAFGLIKEAIANPTQENIDIGLSAIKTAIEDMGNLANSIPIDTALTSAERTSISLAKTNINLESITTSANIQAISALKVNNSAIITTTNAQIEAAQAAVDTIKTQISKTVLTALFNGQVDKDNAVVGQIVSPNVPVITISNNNLEISTFIPEIDLQKIKISDKANITLDAFGLSKIFKATVFSIDKAPTNVGGIPAYGAKLKFDILDASILSGMTANITFTK